MTRSRVNEIDLLRFLAAISVVLHHYLFVGRMIHGQVFNPYPELEEYSKYGWLGVELFFIISGFVILMSAADGSLRRFVISRMVRLYPAFWACCTITFLALIIFGAGQHPPTAGQYLINLTMFSEFLNVEPLDGSYWTLFVELRFYALVAVVLAFNRIDKIQPLLAYWLVASILLELHPVNKLRFFLVVDYSAFFIAGAAFYLVWSRRTTLARAAILLGSWALAMYETAREVSAFKTLFKSELNLYAADLLVSGFFLVMLMVSLGRTGFFKSARFQTIGALTYPLYLIHQEIGYLIFGSWYHTINLHLLFWGTVATVMLIAYLVHIAFEKKLALQFKAALNHAADTIESVVVRQDNDGIREAS